MDQSQTADLLMMAGEITGIRLRDEQVIVWQMALANVAVEDAVSALIEHFADPVTGTEFLKPAHITRVLAGRRAKAALLPRTETMCELHVNYPRDIRTGRCDQCTRYPEDLLPGAPRPVLISIPEALTVGRRIPEEA